MRVFTVTVPHLEDFLVDEDAPVALTAEAFVQLLLALPETTRFAVLAVLVQGLGEALIMLAQEAETTPLAFARKALEDAGFELAPEPDDVPN